MRARLTSFLVLLPAALLRMKDGSSKEPSQVALIADVRDAVGNLVEVIQTYHNSKKISQVMTSTLFKRRQGEAETVIKEALFHLQVSANAPM